MRQYNTGLVQIRRCSALSMLRLYFVLIGPVKQIHQTFTQTATIQNCCGPYW